MKKIFILIFIFILFETIATAETFIVEKVIDGEIIRLTNGKEVHLIGIDVPEHASNEKARRLAEEAKKSLKEITAVGQKAMKFVKPLLEGREVRLEFDVDRFDGQGRIWAYVFDVGTYEGKKKIAALEDHEIANSNEIFINATIVKAGYASPLMIPPNLKHARLFKKLFVEAREKKRGLWR